MIEENLDYQPIGEDFDVKEYVAINNEAAKRTRWISIVLVFATVIIGIGFYNSTDFSWATHRFKAIYDNEYLNRINSSKDIPYPVLDSFFGKKDFKNLKVFACRLWNEQDARQPPPTAEAMAMPTLSSYLFSRLNEKTQALLKKTPCDTAKSDEAKSDEANEAVDETLEMSLFLDLNTILKDKFFYNETRFRGVQLRPETEELLRSRNGENGTIRDLKGKDLIRLNRLLLEDNYPAEILKSRDMILVDGDDDGNVLSPDEKRRLQRQAEVSRAMVDNVQWVTIPVFGIAIDVNDLGNIGGFALLIIVLLLRFSLSREIKNLNISFREAFSHNELCPFYHALAMHQVLTVPNMRWEDRNEGLAICSKLLCLLPIIVISLGIYYDYYSTRYLLLFEWTAVFKSFYLATIWGALIIYFSLRCFERKIHIDEIWDDFYAIMESGKFFADINHPDFQKHADKDLIRIANHRLRYVRKPDVFWFYALLLRIPGFAVAAFKNIFRFKRIKLLFAPFIWLFGLVKKIFVKRKWRKSRKAVENRRSQAASITIEPPENTTIETPENTTAAAIEPETTAAPETAEVEKPEDKT